MLPTPANWDVSTNLSVKKYIFHSIYLHFHLHYIQGAHQIQSYSDLFSISWLFFHPVIFLFFLSKAQIIYPVTSDITSHTRQKTGI